MTCCCIGQVSTAEVMVIERCGKFERLAEAGLVCLCFPYEWSSGVVSLRVCELNVTAETKTRDNVFVTVHISVQYQVIREKVYTAHYLLENPHDTMKAHIFDTVRAELTAMSLDEAFEAKDTISQAVKTHLQETMNSYGFSIINALVTDLSPDILVRNAMNEINSSKRLLEAAHQRAEADKVLAVKRAEAEAESMYLSGCGVARQRKAIMDGLKESIVDFSSKIPDTQPRDIMELLILNQYFDTLEHLGKDGSRVVFTNSEVSNLSQSIMQAQSMQR